jgi:hypothetical protein
MCSAEIAFCVYFLLSLHPLSASLTERPSLNTFHLSVFQRRLPRLLQCHFCMGAKQSHTDVVSLVPTRSASPELAVRQEMGLKQIARQAASNDASEPDWSEITQKAHMLLSQRSLAEVHQISVPAGSSSSHPVTAVRLSPAQGSAADCISIVFSCLSVTDFARCAQTCISWHKAAEMQTAWPSKRVWEVAAPHFEFHEDARWLSARACNVFLHNEPDPPRWLGYVLRTRMWKHVNETKLHLTSQSDADQPAATAALLHALSHLALLSIDVRVASYSYLVKAFSCFLSASSVSVQSLRLDATCRPVQNLSLQTLVRSFTQLRSLSMHFAVIVSPMELLLPLHQLEHLELLGAETEEMQQAGTAVRMLSVKHRLTSLHYCIWNSVRVGVFLSALMSPGNDECADPCRLSHLFFTCSSVPPDTAPFCLPFLTSLRVHEFEKLWKRMLPLTATLTHLSVKFGDFNQSPFKSFVRQCSMLCSLHLGTFVGELTQAEMHEIVTSAPALTNLSLFTTLASDAWVAVAKLKQIRSLQVHLRDIQNIPPQVAALAHLRHLESISLIRGGANPTAAQISLRLDAAVLRVIGSWSQFTCLRTTRTACGLLQPYCNDQLTLLSDTEMLSLRHVWLHLTDVVQPHLQYWMRPISQSDGRRAWQNVAGHPDSC